ncbi:unnamed protein product [Nippostrongylus brasiliensis]|uniref:Histone domain-containing protein n=1 Tax=Nippostrongylus brasiliensis TaxID=27835 RepID=A0A0N4XKK8_NIPBR|nr:unnamed protein product [Nippostrongylus brasiliensis]
MDTKAKNWCTSVACGEKIEEETEKSLVKEMLKRKRVPLYKKNAQSLTALLSARTNLTLRDLTTLFKKGLRLLLNAPTSSKYSICRIMTETDEQEICSCPPILYLERMT